MISFVVVDVVVVVDVDVYVDVHVNDDVNDHDHVNVNVYELCPATSERIFGSFRV